MSANPHTTDLPAPEHGALPARAPSAPGYARKSYFLFLRQLFGVLVIILLACCAWLLTVLPLQQHVTVLIGFGVGLFLFVPGVSLSLAGLAPGGGLLGGGMAFLFFTTASLSFRTPPEAGVWALLPHPLGALLLCAGLLVLFGALAYRGANQPAGMLTCLLAMYLGRMSFPMLPVFSRSLCLLGAAFLFAGWLWLWLPRRRGLAFPAFAVVSLYGAYSLWGGPIVRADALALVVLTLSLAGFYVVTTLLVLLYALRHENNPQGLFALNSLGFGLSCWYLTAVAAGGPSWPGPGVLLVMGLAAALAIRHKPGVAALAGFFWGQATLALMLLVLFYAPPGPNLLLMALLAFLPAVAGLQHAGAVYRKTEYGVLFAVFLASFLVELPAASFRAGPVSVSQYWFFVAGVAVLLGLLARVHYGLAQREDRSSTPAMRLQVRSEHALLSLLCICAAALLIMLHTIIRRNDSESLPFLFSLQGFFFLGLGMLFMKPGLALVGLIPVMAGHACYHAFEFLIPAAEWSSAGIPRRDLALLLLATLLLAVLCDWLLGKRAGDRPYKAERFLAALPYGVLLLSLAVSLRSYGVSIYAPAIMGAGAVGGLLAGRILRHPLPGLQTLGGVALAASLLAYAWTLRFSPIAGGSPNGYLPMIILYLCVLIAAERTLLWPLLAQRNWLHPVSWLLAFLIAALGAYGLYQWNGGPLFALALAGLSLFLALAGYALHARQYCHAALLLLLLSAAWFLLRGHP